MDSSNGTVVDYYAYRAVLIEEALQLARRCVWLESKNVSDPERQKFERDERQHETRVQRFERTTGVDLARVASLRRMKRISDISKLVEDSDPSFKKQLEEFRLIYEGQLRLKVLSNRMVRPKVNGSNRASHNHSLIKGGVAIPDEVVSGVYCSQGLSGLSERDKAQAFVRQIALSFSCDGLFSSQDVWEKFRKEYPGINVSVETIDWLLCTMGGFVLCDEFNAEGKRFFQSTPRTLVSEESKKRRRGRGKKRHPHEDESSLVQEWEKYSKEIMNALPTKGEWISYKDLRELLLKGEMPARLFQGNTFFFQLRRMERRKLLTITRGNGVRRQCKTC